MGGWRWCAPWLALACCGPEVDRAASIELAFIRSTNGHPGRSVVGVVPGEVVVELWTGDSLDFPQLLDWSHDGQYVAFTTGYSRTENVVVLSMQSGETTVFSGMHDVKWSPTALEFIAQRGVEDDVHVSDLILVDFEVGSERVLGRGGVRSYAWAPDGERFVLAGHLVGDPEQGVLTIFDRTGSLRSGLDVQLPSEIDHVTPHQVAWSPLGHALALSGSAPTDLGYSRIYAVDLGTNEVEMWPGDGYGYGDPVWSPDGARVAAHGWVFDAVYPTDNTIVVFDAATKTIVESEAASTSAAWSWDGRWATSTWVQHADAAHNAVVVHDGDDQWISTGGDLRFSDGGPAWRPQPG